MQLDSPLLPLMRTVVPPVMLIVPPDDVCKTAPWWAQFSSIIDGPETVNAAEPGPRYIAPPMHASFAKTVQLSREVRRSRTAMAPPEEREREPKLVFVLLLLIARFREKLVPCRSRPEVYTHCRHVEFIGE